MTRWRVIVAAGLVLNVVIAGSGQTPTSSRDGVFTEDQAKRGQATYAEKCAACHGDDLAGQGFGPALNADAFADAWVDHPVEELASRIRETMPADNPGSLTPETAADIVAFLLKANGYSPGAQPLPADAASQQQIKIVKR